MKKHSPWIRVFVVVLALIGISSLIRNGVDYFQKSETKVSSRHTILKLDLDGVIMNGKKFLKNIKKYREDSSVKAILISINSPGGAVGPSQEIYYEIKRTKDEFKKPIICVSTGIMASGAYYAAAACDKIVVAPGALVGSIGVIMQFANLEKLYDWARVSRYTITSGKFKDSGAEYRSMREDERALFQSMIDETYQQFRSTVKDGRKLKDQILDEYADGRVFTGAKAVELGFADSVGVYEDAVRLAATEAKLGSDYEIFEIPKPKRNIFDWGEDDLDPLNGMYEKVQAFVGLKYVNVPMMIMPGYWD